VKGVTQKGFSEIETTPEAMATAIKTLSELKGVGPATATMILQAKSDDIPFMSDEAMLQTFGGDKSKLKYDLKTCQAFLNQIDDIVKLLSKGNF